MMKIKMTITPEQNEEILKEAERLTKKEYSWWTKNSSEELFGNEIVTLTRQECEEEWEKEYLSRVF